MTSKTMTSETMTKSILISTLLLTSLAPAALAVPAATPESHLLLPYFDVALDGAPETTFFSLVNVSNEEIGLTAQVYTNWAVPVLEVAIRLSAKEALQVDLGTWIRRGELPGGETVCADGTADCLDLTHLQAALAGRPSTIDGLYYGSDVANGAATGFVTIEADNGTLPRADVLWGDYFYADPSEGFAQGQRLVRREPDLACADVCRRHSIRFLQGGAFSGGTTLTVWNWDGVERQPSARPDPPFTLGEARLDVYSQEGELVEVIRDLPVLPAQTIRLADLDLGRPFGWLELTTDESSSVSGLYRAAGRFSVTVPSWCLACDPCDRTSSCYEPENPQCRPAPTPTCYPPRLTINGPASGEVGSMLSLTYSVSGSPRIQVAVDGLPFGLVHESPRIFGIPALATSFSIRATNQCGTAQATVDIRPTVSFATYLTVINEVVNDDGGTASAADFPLYIDSLQVESGAHIPLSAGLHTISEQNLPGYAAGSWRGDCDASGHVNLAPGDDKVCIITNDDIATP